jgi:hypothetical protein
VASLLARAASRLGRSALARVGLAEPPPTIEPRSRVPRHTFRWDLDKTYLRTEFDSLGDLAKSAFETAADKHAFPGAAALMRALRHPDHRICIVSGSPTQMRQVLAAKLVLDGVAYDEFVLKNNLRNLLRGRFRSLRAQIPYKLPAMLESRIGVTAPHETLFGDDAEADAIIYCLYADLLAGRVSAADLERVLAAARAYPDDAERVLSLARQAPKGPIVQRVFIHLDRRSPPHGFHRFGGRLVPVFNYFQTAAVLYADGVLDARQVLFVALEMLDSRQFHVSGLANSVQDLMRRGHVAREPMRRLISEVEVAAASGALSGRTDLPPFQSIAATFRARVADLAGLPEVTATVGEPLDYVRLVDEEHELRRERRRRGH